MAADEVVLGRSPGRQDLQANQSTQVIIVNPRTATARLVFESSELFEAPNWSSDGRKLVLNSRGRLHLLDIATGEVEQIDTQGVDRVNNDHIISPDGRLVYFSAAGHLYSVPIDGGTVRRISNDFPPERHYSYWLHGVTTDGRTLAYVATQATAEDPGNVRALVRLATIPAEGGEDTYLTGDREKIHFDGPEYSPDGEWLYYNSEEAATRPGHAQIFRMRPDATGREQLTFDDRVNWFPHLDPTNTDLVYLSYAPGTISHPADVELEIRMLGRDGGEPRTVTTLFGGQGSMNVNSWAPDGAEFAYAAYPVPSIGGGIDRWS